MSSYHLLADEVVAQSEQTNDTCPSSDNLASQLPTDVLPVSANAEQGTEKGQADRVAQDDRVVRVFPRLVLGLLLLSCSIVLDLLRGRLNFLLTLDALSLRVGLDGLRLVVRGNGGDVGAVDIDKGRDAVIGVRNLRRGRSATASNR